MNNSHKWHKQLFRNRNKTTHNKTVYLRYAHSVFMSVTRLRHTNQATPQVPISFV